MSSRRYTILIANRNTGVTRRFSVSVRAATLVGLAGVALWTLPILIGFGARLSGSFELSQLQAANAALRLENDSYKAATGELTSQIESLQRVVTDLGPGAPGRDEQRQTVAQLPEYVRNRALGGPASPLSTTSKSMWTAMVAPEDTFGVLRDLLGVLDSRLQVAKGYAERLEALASATPSMWPVIGWLNGGFGTRRDPFTGEPAQHLGLDISAEKGRPVYATADGRVDSAAYHGEFGNLVVVKHDFGLATRYAHLSRFAVSAGTSVRRGDLLGYVGSTGRSTAPHLHYEVLANGRAINPLKFLAKRDR
ncbi:MAG: M23 family metallopeptidase [Vicinamibacterales bacterium]